MVDFRVHVLVGVHVAAVILSDTLLKEGLLRSMITGFKQIPDARTASAGEVRIHN